MARILLAEDDESMRRFLIRALSEAGHRVVAVENGREALSYLAAGNFDLLLTDIVMPELDGVTLARRAAELAPDMRVVFITGFAAVALADGDRSEHEAPPVLSKPFHLKDVVAAIDRLCAA
ncbi:MAG: response regulator [Alphaproteobacteria bacterium]|nr:MAG: response regulator [Alphaproteobacteria bacterium]